MADDFARIHIGLGEIDEAFAWMHRAVEDRSVYLAYLKIDPCYEPLRQDPRYDDLLALMNLAG